MSDESRVAVLGCGIMGTAMAGALLRGGVPVTVWDRTSERAQALAGSGAVVAGSPGEAAREVGFVLTMVTDGAAVEAVMLAPGGALSAMRPEGVWLQMSTIGVGDTERLRQAAQDRRLTFVDAPVSGTKEPAERGELLILASGPAAARDRCAPVFDVLGSRTVWLGESGAGTRTKLVLNHWLCTTVAALADVFGLARALGVDPAVVGELVAGRLMPPFLAPKAEQMLSGRYVTAFPLTYAYKDLGLLIEAVEAAGGRAELAADVAARYAEAIARGYGEEDYAAVYAALG